MAPLTRLSLLAGASGFVIIKPELVRGTGPEKLKFRRCRYPANTNSSEAVRASG